MSRFGLVFALIFALSGPAWAAPPKGPLLKPGQPAPAFRLRALDGAMVKLEDLAYPGPEKSYAKKHPLLVDFFRTDCEPCIKAMPELVTVHQKFNAFGLEVVLVALLEDQNGREKLEAYLAQQKLPFKVVIDQSNHFAKKYIGETVSLPATFMIDRNGVLQQAKYDAKGSLGDHFAKTIEAALAEQK
ncbi:MAG: TlpA family protein disulfide reductase [Deltaproteobacteria bacterium]|jgi:peroxiredoxin|nr:TlpA family protein disulfide reductase [Deltaproteobacteria bacterium]